MRHPALIPLSRDHHHALRMAQRLARAAETADRAAMQEEALAFAAFFAGESGVHFREEEEIVFPLLEPGHPLVERAVLEHARLRALAARLAHEAGEADDPRLLAQLGDGLDAHVHFEERELFEAIQREVEPSRLDAVVDALSPREDRPAPASEPAESAGPGALIRAEHAELVPHLDHLRALAEASEDASDEQLRERLLQVRAFLRGAILVHAGLEEETVYPVAEALLRERGGATRTMAIDHELIAGYVDQLDASAEAGVYDEAVRSELRRILAALEALLRGHFEKEERVYVPLLEELAPAEAAALAGRLQTAAASHHHEH